MNTFVMLMRTIIIPMYIIGLSYVTYSNLLLLTKAESLFCKLRFSSEAESLFCKLRCLPQLSQEYSTAPPPLWFTLWHLCQPVTISWPIVTLKTLQSTCDYLKAYSHALDKP